ncbi:hypothetical protein ACH5Y9_09030 [Methylomonas sp. BW4-1]|uniref:hypothetical protein n=1 Tax=Methylomonas sp. BW4-1 TaxID=3376685 RepID=UPI0040430A84
MNVGLKFKSAIQIIKVVGWISEAPSTYLRSYGGWRFAYPPYGPYSSFQNYVKQGIYPESWGSVMLLDIEGIE